MFIGILVFLSLFAVYKTDYTGDVVRNIEYEKELVFVLKVVDGDTIETSNGCIRLLGINNKSL